MKIAILKESAPLEDRVAIVPEVVREFSNLGYHVCIEKDAGRNASIKDQQYIDAGAVISSIPLEVVSDADIILKVQPSALETGVTELNSAKSGTYIIGMLGGIMHQKALDLYKTQGVIALSVERIPRTTIAQSMDVLSSQSNLAGYRSVIEAMNIYTGSMPMMMTAAGTVNPAKVLIMGAGVAGLQAIATAKRMGAVVYAYDVRGAAKEQVESLGARFLQIESNQSYEAKTGYATELSTDDQARQRELLIDAVGKADIIITTAQIPGRAAPRLIDKAMLSHVKPSAVIIDMATSTGGNVEGSIENKIRRLPLGGVIVGHSNLAAKVPLVSSRLYSRNLLNLIKHIFKDGVFLHDNEIAQAIMLK